MTVTEDKLNAFLGKAVEDLGAAVSAVLMLIGDELGLYAALAGHRLSAEELAQKTGTNAFCTIWPTPPARLGTQDRH